MRTGTANLPLHYGKTPPWLFEKMVKLSREICILIVQEFGPYEFLKKISSPFWFQSFGATLGFDWHSSGLTTTVCGAIKESLKEIDKELGIFVAGGKGRTSRKTPEEIESKAKFIDILPEELVYASRMSAKVDSSAVQDGYQLYHHVFFFTKKGEWTVVQQGMNTEIRYARRYHWLSSPALDFVCEPHSGISAQRIENTVLNMVDKKSEENRKISTDLSKQKPEKIIKEIKKLKELELPRRHNILIQDINPDRLYKIFISTYEHQPENFASLLGMKGVGPKTIRALSLVSELLYGAEVSFDDPARFSYAHGGKDGHPYPVDRENYQRTIEILEKAIKKTKIGKLPSMLL